MIRFVRAAAGILSTLLLAGTATADIQVGVTAAATGPIASIGIPTRNTIALLPTNVAGVKVNYLVLDDGADSTTAVKNARKFTSENNVDVLMGSNSTPA